MLALTHFFIVSFPPDRPSNGRASMPSRPLSWASHSKSHSTHNLPQARRTSDGFSSSCELSDFPKWATFDFGTASRSSSVLSYVDGMYFFPYLPHTVSLRRSLVDTERQHDTKPEKIHERERGWNHPQIKSPARPATPDRSHHQHTHSSPSHNAPTSNGRASSFPQLSRKGSAASLRSDDGRSSRASSVSSRSECTYLLCLSSSLSITLTTFPADHERLTEAEEEKKKERERQWNRPHSRLRSLSNVSMHSPPERNRTQSYPTRPDTSQGFLSPDRSRRSSLVSVSSSSRAASPASSASGHEPEPGREVEHVRERNWNSPHPNWKLNHRRSISPFPDSPDASPAQSDPDRVVNGSSPRTSHHHVHSHTRGSLDGASSTKPPSSRDKPKEKPATPKENSTDKSTSVKDRALAVPSPIPSRSKSPSLIPSHQSKLPRPSSPRPHPTDNGGASKIQSFATRSGWKFPGSRVPLPPLNSHEDLPRSPSPPRPVSRTSTRRSQIPVKSPRRDEPVPPPRSTSPSPADEIASKKGHRRSLTEWNQPIGRVPPTIRDEPEDEEVPELPEIVLVGDAGTDDIHGKPQSVWKLLGLTV